MGKSPPPADCSAPGRRELTDAPPVQPPAVRRQPSAIFVRAAPFAPDQIEFFRTLNPNTRVPILLEDGVPLWETDAIACRLCQITGSDLWPAPPRLPELLRWLSWSHQHFNPPASALYFEHVVKPTFTSEREPESVMDRHLKQFREFAAVLDGALEGRRWLIDDKLSYADMRVAFVFPYAARAQLPLADYPEVERLARQLDELPAWRDPFRGLEPAS